MTYQSYGTKKSTPSRMARKHMRVVVFMHNSKAAKAKRKARRLARQNAVDDNE